MASAPACSGVIDTFEYTLIGSLEGDVVEPASSDTASVSIAIGTALRQVDAVDDAAGTTIGVCATGNVLVNDCDQTNTTPASPDNVTAALSTSPTNGTAVVDADGATVYTPKAGFVGTDSFTYTIATIGLAGGALLLLGGSLVGFARRRQADIGWPTGYQRIAWAALSW